MPRLLQLIVYLILAFGIMSFGGCERNHENLVGPPFQSESTSGSGIGDIPKDFALLQNYPNPFNPMTSIPFQLPRSTPVSLKALNCGGKEIRTLVDQICEAGYYAVSWDGRDKDGVEVASGIYKCELRAGDFTAAIKMVLVR